MRGTRADVAHAGRAARVLFVTVIASADKFVRTFPGAPTP